MTGLRGETLVTLKPTPRHLTQSPLKWKSYVPANSNIKPAVCFTRGRGERRAIQRWIHLISRGQTEFFFFSSSPSPPLVATRRYIYIYFGSVGFGPGRWSIVKIISLVSIWGMRPDRGKRDEPRYDRISKSWKPLVNVIRIGVESNREF